MRLLEHQSKRLLSRFGLTFTPAVVATTVADAQQAAAEVSGSVVFKAQVPFGGRGKAGAVLFADSPAEAGIAAEQLLGMEVHGHKVRAISIEPKVAIAKEFYLGIGWDSGAKRPVAILSADGGVEVERAARVVRKTFDPMLGLRPFEAREMACEAGLVSRSMSAVSVALVRLADAFISLDGVTVEVNPLAETPAGALIGLDAHVEMDDDASARQQEHLKSLGNTDNGSGGRVPTSLEKMAEQIDAMDHRGVAGRVVEFDGDMALLMGGGGASLTVFDAVRRYGGRPANYCEVGGNPTEEKVSALVELLLRKPGVRSLAVIMNVVNNTRADVMARGTIKGIRSAGRVPNNTITVFRIPGSWELEAASLLAEVGIKALGREISLDSAAQLAVERGQYHVA